MNQIKTPIFRAYLLLLCCRIGYSAILLKQFRMFTPNMGGVSVNRLVKRIREDYEIHSNHTFL